MDNEIVNKFLTPDRELEKTLGGSVAVDTETAPQTTDTPVIEPVVTEPAKTEPVTKVADTIIPDHFKKFEEWSGGKYKVSNDDEAKKFFEEHDNIQTEFKSRKERDEYYESVDKWIEEKGKMYDPVAIVGGEDNYRKIVLVNELGKHGDRDTASRLVSSDLDKMEDLDVLSLFTQYQTPRLAGKDKTTKDVILSDLGIETEGLDFNNLELDDKQAGRLAIKAAEVRDKIKSAINGVQVPTVENPLREKYNEFEQRKTRTEELKGKWNETMTSLQSSFNKITFDESGFEFEIPEEEKSILKDFINAASKQGIEPNEANKQMILQRAKDAVEDRNRLKIRLAYKAKIEADIKSQKDAEHHNLQPLNTDKVIPDNKNSTEAEMALRRQMNLKI